MQLQNIPEFHTEGKAWLDKIGFPKGNDKYKFDPDKVCEAIDFIGADVKKIDAPKWMGKCRNNSQKYRHKLLW